MALTFTTTTPSAASVAAVAAIIQSAWRDALTAHASGAWTLVEEWDSAGGTIHHVVVKNSTSVSAVGVDFYVVISRRVSDGEIRVAVGEGYTTGGHVLSTYAARNAAAAAINANGTFTASSYSLAATLPGIGGSGSEPTTGYTSTAVPGASTCKCTTYVTEKMAILSHYLASGNAMTFCAAVGGFGDSLIQAPSVDQPIIGMADLVYPQIGNAALTRHPVEAADATMRYPQQLYPPAVINFPNVGLNQMAVRCGNYYGGDRYQGGRVAACEVGIIMYAPFQNSAGSTPATQSGTLRGKFSALKYGGFADVGVPGDTVVVDGKKHMLIGKNNSNPIAAGQSGPYLALMMDTGA